ncbi:MAG: histidine--tRNA ligase [Candidatus Thermoplasmatota archaeon]|nr:histidine--tRNA ligase [Candidatus Thermoplasmatota archaeon]MCL5790932.1 histidine--tRNA ligase [Candidatus Thermoplasmatota archaeon]
MIDRLKGFRDFYPEDMEIRENIFSTMRERARVFGFRPIDYPSLELLEMFRLKSGDEILSQTYSFRDRGDREITLIPEATPSTVRMLVARKDLPRPVRWYNIPKLWRYEEPQSGRTREHVQMNADIFGDDSAVADADIIGLACSILNSLGLESRYEVRINERKIMEYILTESGSRNILSDMAVIDRFHKSDKEEIVSKLSANGMGSENAERMYDFLGRKYKINAIEEGIGEFFNFSDFREKIQRLERTGEILVDNGFRDVVFNPSTVRGLAYYTGIVFEGFDIQGKFRSIFGGGRYDNLSSLFSGIEIPAVGFGMGDAVLENLMRDLDLWKQKSKVRRYYIIGIGDAGNLAAVKMAFSLRDRGIQAVAHTGGKNLSNAMKTASNLNFTHAVMIGSKEIEEKNCTVRDLASGEQKNVNPDDI